MKKEEYFGMIMDYGFEGRIKVLYYIMDNFIPDDNQDNELVERQKEYLGYIFVDGRLKEELNKIYEFLNEGEVVYELTDDENLEFSKFKLDWFVDVSRDKLTREDVKNLGSTT